MSAQILDGKILAGQLKEQLKNEVLALKKNHGRAPCLLAISFLKDPAIDSYRLSQQKAAESVGIEYQSLEYLAHTEDEIVIYLKDILAQPQYDAVFFFKPLPSHIDFNKVTARVRNLRNVEGVDAFNLGNLLLNELCFIPPTPAGALALLKSSGVDLRGKSAVVLGRSEIVGKPIALLLIQENMTVTVCHSKTQDLPSVVRQADVVIAAVGKPLFVKGDWIKPGAILIDVGINDLQGRIVGDLDFDSCKTQASFISPVPGGVGPVTSVMLMSNVLKAFKILNHIHS